ncbi:ABC transporter permease [Leucobacter ruminantium]|uniref:ABC transporter permease subunit n=1 Tax=Leucobacter ruminantium TaxID=1289170 RepID=A0A939M0U4_9MICO|nr:ABC transporter permease subunit [Leucobacter ruminantium]MBO1804990.1 ABC transporter permease subunit [Leucobacter ruminantium]
MSARVPGRPSRAVSYTVIAIIGGVFLIPLLAMLEFTLRQTSGGYGAEHWAALFDPENARKYRVLFKGIGNSFVLAGLSLVIVLALFFPTIVLVHLRFPRLQRALDLLTVLPIAIPAIVLVVGFAPIYRVIGQMFGSGVWSLSLAYGVLVLPFAYRAIVADLHGMDARTRAEAARSLGAGWGTVLVRVIAPGVRRGLLAASLLTIAIVLGEFTVSSLLNRTTLQVALLQVSKSDPFVAVIVSLLSLVGAFLVLLAVSSTGGPPRRRARRRTRSTHSEES